MSALVHPALQVHEPEDEHSPLRQLQVEGSFLISSVRHLPDPEIPSSQSLQPLGHAAQVGPKNPDAQDSHDEPVKPGAHVQVPDVEQIPFPEHAGEHALDWRSRTDMAPERDPSWLTSGTDSQRMTRSVSPMLTAAHTLGAIASEDAVILVDEFEMGSVGSFVCLAVPA